MQTTDGENVRIIDCGNEGEKSNVFYNARIIIGDKEWCGNVILHNRSSDWEKEDDPDSNANSNIILHVTAENNCDTLRRHGEAICQIFVYKLADCFRSFGTPLIHKCLQITRGTIVPRSNYSIPKKVCQ